MHRSKLIVITTLLFFFLVVVVNQSHANKFIDVFAKTPHRHHDVEIIEHSDTPLIEKQRTLGKQQFNLSFLFLLLMNRIERS